MRALRALALVAACAAAAVVPAAAGSAQQRAKLVSSAGLQASPPAFRDSVHAGGGRALADAGNRWGGAVTARTGETVDVYVSSSYPVDPSVTQHMADFVASLYHGSELQSAAFYLAPPAEITRVCGGGDSGCVLTAQNTIVAPGADLRDGTSVETIIAHEYGHFVALYRQNPPWRALDWGPKRWASQANVCARTKAGTAFPGNEGANYDLNPGEAWAETYRLLNYRHLVLPGWAAAPWNVDDSWQPDAGDFDAARADVLDPWQNPTLTPWSATLQPQAAFRPPLAKKKAKKVRRLSAVAYQATRTLETPRDGTFVVSLGQAPAGATISVGDGAGHVLATGTDGSAQATICGQRTVTLTVTAPSAGPLTATLGTP
jgi:hypothetical protein